MEPKWLKWAKDLQAIAQAYKFCSRNSLPELSVGRNTPEQIEMCFRSRLGRVPETAFD